MRERVFKLDYDKLIGRGTWEKPTQTTIKEPRAASAVEDVATSVVSFDPFKFVRTFRYVITSPNRIAEAVATQNWEEILSPAKYFSACLGILGVGMWLFLNLGAEDSGWSFKHPFIYEF